MSFHIEIKNGSGTGDYANQELFGTNYLFHRQESENFEILSEELSLSGARYPGGSITEHFFDINNPDEIPEGFTEKDAENFTPLSEFLDSCNALAINPMIVLPTSKAINANGELNEDYIQDIKAFVKNTIDRCGTGKEFENINIDSFEIGNEYWGVEGMTAAEYGSIADKMSIAIQQVLDDEQGSNPEADILVQMGNPVRGGADFKEGGVFFGLTEGSTEADELGLTAADFDENGNIRWVSKVKIANEQIINELSDESAEAIDGLVEHYYYRQSLEEDPALEYNPHSTNFIDLEASHWRSAGFDDPLHITEWNTSLFDYDNFGQVGAGILIAQMSHMINMGVESAMFWPLQHNTPNDLGGGFDSEPTLSPLGGAFQVMSEIIPGMELQDSEFDHEKMKLISYARGDNHADFLISRSDEEQEIQLNFEQMIGSETEVTMKKLYVDSDGMHWEPGTGNTEVEYYRDHNAVSTLFEERVTVDQSGEINITLRPFEVAIFEYELEGGASEIIGTDGNDYLEGNEDYDVIIGLLGDDTLVGNSGDDELYGHAGADRIRAGAGDDIVYADEGDDEVWANDGHDVVFAGTGDDTVWGGNDEGADTLYGGAGDDFVNSGKGNDIVHGEEGNDIVWAGSGSDLVYSGLGDDTVGAGHGNDEVYGGEGSDTLWGGVGNDLLDGGAQGDLVVGGTGDDILFGRDGDDQLWGGVGKDSLVGGDGRDFINSGGGDDWISGGGGGDICFGGLGADTFVYDQTFSGLVDIRDFAPGEGDILKIHTGALSEHLRDLSTDDLLDEICVQGGDYGLAIRLDEAGDEIFLKGVFDRSEIEDSIEFYNDVQLDAPY